MQSTQTLPEGYRKAGTLDIAQDRRLMLILNIAGLILLVLAGWLFFQALIALRSGDTSGNLNVFEVTSLVDLVLLVFWIIVLTMLNMILHEAIHGIFFWLFTRSQPKFAFKWVYAYAAAPDWFLARTPFLITTVAPLVVISLLGLLVIGFAPPAWLIPVWFMITMNASGAVGDLLVTVWLLRHPADTLVQDRGDAVTLYVK